MNRLLSIFLSATLLLSLLPAATPVKVTSLEDLSHTIANEEVTITDCDVSMLTYVIFNGEITITKCSPIFAGELVIPDTIEGVPVVRIGTQAFENCDYLTNVVLPIGLKEIWRRAFYGCDGLTHVTIPAGVTMISYMAFAECKNLDTVQFLGNIPACPLSDPNENQGPTDFDPWDDEDGYSSNDAFHHTDATGYYPAEHTSWATERPSCDIQTWVPSCSIHTPGEWMTITEATSSVQGLKGQRCTVCGALLSAEWFTAADQIVTGSLGDDLVWTLDSAAGVLTVAGSGAITGTPWREYAAEIQRVNLERGVTGIGAGAFKNLSNLRHISIPDTVTAIGAGAFEGCTSLEYTVQYHGSEPTATACYLGNAENPCYALIALRADDFGADQRPEGMSYEFNISVDDRCKLIASAVDYITNVASYHVYSERIRIHVVLPKGLTTIGDYAFRAVPYQSSTTLGYGLLTSINLPASLTSIGAYAFEFCAKLQNITIPDKDISIGRGAFFNCNSIKQITLPTAMKEIPPYLFSGCDNLASVILPGGVTAIGECAFSDCYSLSSITIPAWVTTIDFRAFDSCLKLHTVTFLGSAPQIDETAFNIVTATVYYPGDDPAWTGMRRQDYDGTLTWVPVYSEHDHTYGEEITVVKDATCTEGILKSRSCVICDRMLIWFEEGTALGHDLEIITTESTCTEDGARKQICKNCDYQYVLEIIAEKTGHDYQDNQCTICGDVRKGTFMDIQVVPTKIGCDSVDYTVYAWGTGVTAMQFDLDIPKGMTYVPKSASIPSGLKHYLGWVNVDWYEKGMSWTGYNDLPAEFEKDTVILTFSCTVDAPGTYEIELNELLPFDDEYNEFSADLVAVPVTVTGEHDFSEVTTAPTCTEKGYTSYCCNHCGYCYEDDYLGATGHTPGVWVTVKEPSATEDGLEEQRCTLCHELLASEVLQKRILGKCGDNMTWCLYPDTGLLTISGSGEMSDANAVPWAAYAAGITAVQIGEGVETLRSFAFNECTALTRIELPESLVSIGSYAFFGCGALTDVTLPEGLTALGSHCFYGCKSMTAIEIPRGVTVLPKLLFTNCTALASVTLNQGIGVIGDSVFFGCKSLQELTLPESLSAIEIRAFYKCSALTALTVPENVTSVGSQSFYKCSALTALTFLGDAPTLAEDAFQNLTATVRYPAENESWTDVAGKSYSGTITWEPWREAAVVTPTLTLKAPSLEFKDLITVNAMFTAENIDDVVEMGMITYSTPVEQVDVQSAEYVIPGTTYDALTGRYIAQSQGIHAKYLGDTVYLACYAMLTDGSYVYTKLAQYSPVQYATNQLKNSTDMKLKQLCVAMLNFGAEAQLFFGHHTDALANAVLTADLMGLAEPYRTDMVAAVAAVSAQKQGAFVNNQGFAKRYPSISFDGAFCINYFFTPNYTPVDGITLYYWYAAQYDAVSVLTTANASGSFKLEGTDAGQYSGDIAGIAAKSLSDAVYVAAVYSDGTTEWASGVLGYSIGAYCSSQISKGAAVSDLTMATAVYGYHAKQYFE